MSAQDNAEKLLALVDGPQPAARLTGATNDDTYAVSAGTGQKLAVLSPTGTIDGGTL